MHIIFYYIIFVNFFNMKKYSFPSTSLPLGGRLVTDTEKAMSGISLRRWLTSVVFPEPEGAEKISNLPFFILSLLLFNINLMANLKFCLGADFVPLAKIGYGGSVFFGDAT